ncbi:MAG TPA: metalloregulator ArsR/SmtB family transcription factor [Chitinophagaceae bacterium]|nr:metalloregulator ArsR/SmtB family transcription factor [Chitinophagaceae bacterium]
MNTHAQVAIITDASTNESVRIDFLHMKKASMILRALNHKLRQQVIKLLDEHQKMTVTEIYVKLRLEQSVASQHLAILRRAGIVGTRREGKFIFYSINYGRVKEISHFVEEFLK